MTHRWSTRYVTISGYSSVDCASGIECICGCGMELSQDEVVDLINNCIDVDIIKARRLLSLIAEFSEEERGFFKELLEK